MYYTSLGVHLYVYYTSITPLFVYWVSHSMIALCFAICLAKFGENIKQNMLFGMKSRFQAVLGQFQAVLPKAV